MKVREIMTAEVSSYQPETNLADVAKTMWDRDCGIGHRAAAAPRRDDMWSGLLVGPTLRGNRAGRRCHWRGTRSRVRRLSAVWNGSCGGGMLYVVVEG
jgi:hypothetical protein